MKKKRLLSASRDPNHEGPKYTFHDPLAEPNSITLCCSTEEMLRIAPDGFYIRGVKLEQDDNEAGLVYNAFREFLVYHNLTRSW